MSYGDYMIGGFKFTIMHSAPTGRVEIWFFRKVNINEYINVEWNGSEMVQHFVKEDDFLHRKNDVKPFLVLPCEVVQDFFNAVLEHGKNRGYKTDDETLLEGKLSAKEEHLKDMREFANRLLSHVEKKK